MSARKSALARSLAAPLLLACALLCLSGPSLAQHHPFAVGANEGAAAPAAGIVGWIANQQAHFYRALTDAVRQARHSAAGFWMLAGLSFGYGVFHAAGPGHGKAVMASYMVANERALRRGLALTLFAALLQGSVAIAIVGVAALIFNATAPTMTRASEIIEYLSYAAVAALGLWLIVKKGSAFFAALRASAPQPAFAGAPQSSRFVCEEVDPDHIHGPTCGHYHAPDPAMLGDNFSWGQALATVVAAGARPCSGAILVLVFALAQGVFLAGVGATLAMSLGTAVTTGALAASAVLAKNVALRFTRVGDSRAALIARGAEFFAALAVFVLGLLLLAGSIAARV